MAGAKIALSSTSGELKTDGNDNARVNLPMDPLKSGYAVIAGEPHNGAAGLAAVRRPIKVSSERRLAVGIDNVLFEDFFSHAILNTRKYSNIVTTMTTTLSGGLLTLNAGNSVATAVGNSLSSYKTFPLSGNFPIVAEFWFGLSIVPQANNLIMLGLGVPGVAVTASTDGIFLVIDSAGALTLNCYYNNSTPTTSSVIPFTWAPNQIYHAELMIHRDGAELYIDDVLYASIDRAPSVGATTHSQTGKLIAHLINTGTTVSAQKVLLAGWIVSQRDAAFNKQWGQTKTGMGDGLVNTPDGVAVGSLTNTINSTGPVSATLSNTAAGYTTLGGNFQFAAVAGAETDYALFAYTVPAGTAAIPGKSFRITGVSIDSWNMGAVVATTPTLLNWYVGVGATAVSLATTDGANQRSPGKVFIGAQSFPVGAAIGARADRWISEIFDSAPLQAEPGTIVHVILRMPVGTATASQIIRGAVRIDGFIE